VLGKEKLSDIANQVLKLSSADQTEVLIFSNDEHLTRFAVNTIHQNVSETDVTVRVRAVFGKKTLSLSAQASGSQGSRRLF